ncbi:MAG TPA: VWA domain-containing protein [Terracidiphilus sp.]|jgi:VWFA-related protein|nr:VWA domain-containing protein [Terracidiphilus sp.]
MRRYLLCLILLCASVPAFAARSIPVGELEQQLAALRGKADEDAAFQIGTIVLTERLSWARESELEMALPGEKSRQALRAIADESQFRDPPPNEIPQQPAPDAATQRQIMGRVVAYVSKTIPQLPNFLASRVTDQYEDAPQLVASQQAVMVPYQPIHFLVTQKSEVAYQDGKEMQGGAAKVSAPLPTASGLNTWGVFGPILGVVLVDAARSQLAWSHWEQGADGVRAVFSYAVPKAKSHYEVVYCCVAEQAGLPAASMFPFRKLEGYHGEIAVDAATGIIRRLTLKAELKADDPVVKGDIMVEYGPVEIGGQTYTCPLRSVSSSRAESVQVDPNYHFSLANQMQPLKNQIADTTFESYHVFRAETRVLTAAEAGEAEKAAPVQQAAVQAPGAAPASITATSPAAPAATAPAEGAAKPNVAETATSEPALPRATAPPADAEPEISENGEAGVPDLAAAPQKSAAQATVPSTGFTLRTISRLVDVAVVAFDKKGRPITDLKPSDLEILDNSRPQEVRFFSQAGAEPGAGEPQAGTAGANGPEGAVPAAFSNRGNDSGAAGANSTILLIDSASLSWSDFTYARAQMLEFLHKADANEPIGFYAMKRFQLQVLLEPTLDHAKVAAALGRWMPSSQDLMNAQHEEEQNRQHIDWVHSTSDLAYVNGNDATDPEGSAANAAQVAQANVHGVDPQLRNMGSNPAAEAMFVLVGIAQHLAARPGHKSLVWVSSDNALADFTNQAASREDKGPEYVDSLEAQSQEALNQAHVSVYPLDASQLEASVITADLGNRLVQSINPPLPGEPVPPPAPGGRLTAEMHQDTHPIQPAFRELAEATGGQAFRRSGEIAHEIDSVVADGRAAYLLSFSPDTQADGKYHKIVVRTERKDIRLRYRSGYFYAKEPATMKDRFREAVWQPREEMEIGLTAAMVREPTGEGLRLNIAATDLEMAQQGGRWTDKVDVFLVVRDDSGVHAAIGGKRLGLSLKPATYQRDLKDGLTVEEKLPKMPAGAQVRLIVIDENSRRIGSVTVDAGQWTVNSETAKK